MKATFTLTENELRTAVVEWLENNSEYGGNGNISSPSVNFFRDAATGAWSATVEVVEMHIGADAED